MVFHALKSFVGYMFEAQVSRFAGDCLTCNCSTCTSVNIMMLLLVLMEVGVMW